MDAQPATTPDPDVRAAAASPGTFTRRDLVRRVASAAGRDIRQFEIQPIVDAVFDAIAEALAAGRRCEFRDFGAFEPVLRGPRLARNPHRPENTYHVPPRATVRFKVGAGLRASIDRAFRPAVAPPSQPPNQATPAT